MSRLAPTYDVKSLRFHEKIASHTKNPESWTSAEQKKQTTGAVLEGPRVLDRLHKHIKNSYFKYNMSKEVKVMLMIYMVYICVHLHTHLN